MNCLHSKTGNQFNHLRALRGPVSPFDQTMSALKTSIENYSYHPLSSLYLACMWLCQEPPLNQLLPVCLSDQLEGRQTGIRHFPFCRQTYGEESLDLCWVRPLLAFNLQSAVSRQRVLGVSPYLCVTFS